MILVEDRSQMPEACETCYDGKAIVNIIGSATGGELRLCFDCLNEVYFGILKYKVNPS